MKGRHRKNREAGGVNEAEMDLKDRPEARTNAKKIDDEAMERKDGGRAARKRGGGVEKKHVGMVHGDMSMHHAGRKPRKSGGRTGADSNPFSSARRGEAPMGHKTPGSID